MPAIIRELQYAIRRLRSTPGFTVAATCTLAIAIGATASVFGLVHGVLLKPFPFREPDQVFAIVSSNPVLNLPRFSASPADFIDWRAQSTAFSAISASESGDVTVTVGSHSYALATGQQALIIGTAPANANVDVVARPCANPAAIALSDGKLGAAIPLDQRFDTTGALGGDPLVAVPGR